MKFTRAIFGLLLLLALIGILAWWFFPTQDNLAVMSAPKSSPLQAAVAPKPAPGIVVEAPTAAPPSILAGGGSDPQENLDTAIADVTRLAQANNFGALFENYGVPVIDPTLRYRNGGNILDDVQQKVLSFQAYLNSPGGQTDRQQLQATLEFMRTQTPVYNATGDQATIQIGPITDQDRAANLIPQITFVKKDGRWYLQAGNPFGW